VAVLLLFHAFKLTLPGAVVKLVRCAEGQETLSKYPRIWVLLLACLALQAVGCITIKRRTEVKKEEIRPQLESSEQDLLASYNNQVRAVQTLQATVDLIPSTGTTYSGVIEEYHDVPGFILAARPATVRMIGQAPVVAKNIFDMVSDGKEFRIYIPSKNSFLVGPTSLVRASKKPLENLRPQHVVEALFWPEFPPTASVLFEQFDFNVSRYYVLTLLRKTEAGKLAIDRKVWYSRTDLRVSRVQLFGAGGKLDSDITYSDWEPVPPAAAADAPAAGGAPQAEQPIFARDIHIWRPQDDYKLEIKILKLSLNELISPDRFELAQPAGTDLVRVGDDPSGAQLRLPPGSRPESHLESQPGSQPGSQQ
jgi:outer membrane lipoprotein-sorting protein